MSKGLVHVNAGKSWASEAYHSQERALSRNVAIKVLGKKRSTVSGERR